MMGDYYVSPSIMGASLPLVHFTDRGLLCLSFTDGGLLCLSFTDGGLLCLPITDGRCCFTINSSIMSLFN